MGFCRFSSVFYGFPHQAKLRELQILVEFLTASSFDATFESAKALRVPWSQGGGRSYAELGREIGGGGEKGPLLGGFWVENNGKLGGKGGLPVFL